MSDKQKFLELLEELRSIKYEYVLPSYIEDKIDDIAYELLTLHIKITNG